MAKDPVLLVMEFADGGSLLKYLQEKNKAITTKEQVTFCQEIAEVRVEVMLLGLK